MFGCVLVQEQTLPHRKYEQSLQELCVVHCNVSTHARALVDQLIQLVLQLAPDTEYTLPNSAAERIMSVAFHGAADPNSSPLSFVAVARTCEAVLKKSDRSCLVLALRLAHTLWGEALNQVSTPPHA